MLASSLFSLAGENVLTPRFTVPDFHFSHVTAESPMCRHSLLLLSTPGVSTERSPVSLSDLPRKVAHHRPLEASGK